METLESALINQILASCVIYSEATRRLQALKSYLIETVFGTANTTTSDDLNQDLIWIRSLPPEFLSQFNNSNIYQAFELAEKTLDSTNYLIIYLPFELPPSELHNLAQYLRGNFGNSLLFEVKFDPLLIGGCSLVWKGVYRDYSLKQKLADNHYEILKMLKEYVS